MGTRKKAKKTKETKDIIIGMIILNILASVFLLTAILFKSDSLYLRIVMYQPQPYFMDKACEEFTCVSSLSEYSACFSYVHKYNISNGVTMCENLGKSMALNYDETSTFGGLQEAFDWDAHKYWIKIGGWVYILLFIFNLVTLIVELILYAKN